MRLIILLLLPLTGFSQVGFTISTADLKVKTDTLPTYDKWIEDSIIIGNTKFIGNKAYTWKRPEPKLYVLPSNDTLPTYGGTTSQDLNWYNGTRWYSSYYNETKKGKIETPINVMDTGLKIETVETRDTIYKCPQTYGSRVLFFNADGKLEAAKEPDCTVEKIVTTRRYKLYIINEYGQKEYLSMELSKVK